jgi:hypothetical protein
MALIQQTMSEKNLAAHQRNARQSHGAVTPEGKERARAANLRHGYYSELREQALVALGEDPEALAALVEGARQQFRPANAYQAWITDRLASLQWRIQRAERLQESQAATHIRRREAKRQEAARQLRERWADVEDFLDSLHRAVARPDFYAPAGCFERYRDVTEQHPSANMEQILVLLHQLRWPVHFSEPLPSPLPEAMSEQEWQDTLRDDQYDESSVPHPEVPVAQGPERDPLREQLWNLAGEELRRAREAWEEAIAAQEAPLSGRARDLLVLEISEKMELPRREERSCFREFWRLGNDLRKLQKEAAVPDQKAQDRDQQPRVQASGSEEAAGEDIAENAGASGYVKENTQELEGAVGTERPPTASQPEPEPVPSDEVFAELSPAICLPSPVGRRWSRYETG